MILSRRSFFTGLAAAIAAPAVVRASSIMPVKPLPWRVVEGVSDRWRGFPWADFTLFDKAFNEGAEAVRHRLIDPPVVAREFATREEAESAARLAARREAARYGQSTSFFDDVQRTINVGQISDAADLLRPHETIIMSVLSGQTPFDPHRNMADEIVREFVPRRLSFEPRRGKGRGRL